MACQLLQWSRISDCTFLWCCVRSCICIMGIYKWLKHQCTIPSICLCHALCGSVCFPALARHQLPFCIFPTSEALEPKIMHPLRPCMRAFTGYAHNSKCEAFANALGTAARASSQCTRPACSPAMQCDRRAPGAPSGFQPQPFL